MDSHFHFIFDFCSNSYIIPVGASAFPTSRVDPDIESLKTSWDEQSQEEATLLEDRQYTVFRGNAPMSASQKPLNFQTWGVGKSMRFATVHMTHPGTLGTREEKQVWFITMDDTNHQILNEPDPVKRQQMLLHAFADWHDPICDMVASTPADQILGERAMAHRHSVAPVDNMNSVLHQIRGKRPPSSGKGPAMVFIGDAFMTVDPILAQGFSMGMEAAANLVHPVGASCQRFHELLFDPYKLRQELAER
jgi:2-polyprenyl-6-methoxyphenol hydroxylase-like FAD-dependent oxidoreductase